VFKSVLAHYFTKMIKPYLMYDKTVVEMDETKVGGMIYKSAGRCDEFKWVFGMICRKAKIPLLYFVKNTRGKSIIHSLIKSKIKPGCVVLSD
jgi:hypothetical protein